MRQTVLNQIEVRPDGTLQLRFDKQIVDGDLVTSLGWHRSVLLPGDDLKAHIKLVNESLVANDWGLIEKPAFARIDRIRKIEHTPAAIAAFKQNARSVE